MLRTIAAALMACAFCGTAAAQNVPMSDTEFGAQADSIFQQSKASGQTFAKAAAKEAAKQAPSRLLENVMVAMYDAPGTGEMIVGWLRGNNAVVEFSDTMKERSANMWLGDFQAKDRRPGVYISSELSKQPASYRLLGCRIAKEASELMLAGFPESAEKRYIAAARVAETYFELGGTRIALPNFDGIKDEPVAATIWIWVENAGDQGVQLLKSRGNKTLAEVMAALKAQLQDAIDHSKVAQEKTLRAQIDAVKKAQDDFAQFKKDETDWLMSHQNMLQ